MKMIALKDWKKTNARKATAEVARDVGVAHTPRIDAPGIIEIGKGRVGVDVAKTVLMSMGLAGDALAKQLDVLADGDVLATYTMSTDVVDRPGDKIIQDGWDLNEFRDNPVMLFVHNAGDLPIGKAVATFLSKSALKGTFKFVAESVYPFGACVARVIKSGFMPAGSVGFIPTEWRVAEERVDKDDPWAAFFPPLDFLKAKLLEFSACPIPANPEALVDAKGLASSDAKALRGWAEKILAGEGGRVLTMPKGYVENLAKLGTKGRVIVDVKRAEGDDEEDDVTVTEDPEAKAEGGAQGCCPECGHEGALADFVDDEGGDAGKTVADADTKTLLTELRKRGVVATRTGRPIKAKSETPAADPSPAASTTDPAPVVDEPAADPAVVVEPVATPEVLTPEVEAPAPEKTATLPNASVSGQHVFASNEELKAFLDAAIKAGVDEALMQMTGRLPS